MSEGRPASDGVQRSTDVSATEMGRLEGEVAALRERLAAADATEEHHRVELDTARRETAEAQALAREAEARAEQLQRRVDETMSSLRQCEEARERAEAERAAVIEALGRRARRRLQRATEPSTESGR